MVTFTNDVRLGLKVILVPTKLTRTASHGQAVGLCLVLAVGASVGCGTTTELPPTTVSEQDPCASYEWVGECAAAPAVSARSDQQSNWPKEIANFQQALIEPTLRALQLRSEGDACLQNLLARVQFRAGNTEGLAVSARSENAEDLISMELGFLRKAFDQGEDTAMAVLRERSSDLAEMPNSTRAFRSRLAMVVGMDVVAWAILHEAAHHRLGHTGTELPSACVKPQESAADRLAFQWMGRLGFSQAYLRAYFSLRAADPGAVVWSDHPDYEERLSTLEAAFADVPAVDPNRWRGLSFVLPRHQTGGLVFDITLGPLSVNPTATTVTAWEESWSSVRPMTAAQAYLEAGQEICLRTDEDELIRVTVTEPHAEFPLVNVHWMARTPGGWDIAQWEVATAFPQSAASAIGATIAANMSSLEEKLEAAGARGVAAEQAAALLRSHEQLAMESLHDVSCKGYSVEYAQAAAAERRAERRTQLEALIGREAAQRFDDLGERETGWVEKQDYEDPAVKRDLLELFQRQ